MTEHQLKIDLVHYNRVKEGTKNFEIRQNDRVYQKGDVVVLFAWSSETNEWLTDYEPLKFVVGYVHPLNNDWVAFSLLPATPEMMKAPISFPPQPPRFGEVKGIEPQAANKVTPIKKGKKQK